MASGSPLAIGLPGEGTEMKDHEIAALVNQVRDVAVEFAGTEQLRARLSALLVPVLKTENTIHELAGIQCTHGVDMGKHCDRCAHGDAIFEPQTQSEAAQTMTIQEVWIELGGNPAVTATRGHIEQAFRNLRLLAGVKIFVTSKSDEEIDTSASRVEADDIANAQSKVVWEEGYQYGLSIGRKDPAVQEAAYARGYKGAQAISQMLLEACRDALEMSAHLFPDEVLDWRLKRVQKALREVKAAMANGIGADVACVYAAGWYTCARWAQRSDLLSDVGSPAYERDRLQAMAKLGDQS